MKKDMVRVRAGKLALISLRSGDNPNNEVGGHLTRCRWGDRNHTTRNHSGICDGCWRRSLATEVRDTIMRQRAVND